MTQYRGTKCLNCEHPLDVSDKYCCNCGQKNSTKRLSVKDFFHEFLSNFYAYDSKVKNTIFSLFTKPGHGALEFIQGKKASYANPFRFYLSVSLIYFIIVGFYDKVNKLSEPEEIVSEAEARKRDSIAQVAVLDSLKKAYDSNPNAQKIFPSQEKLLEIKVDTANISKKKDTITKLYYQQDIHSLGFLKRTILKSESMYELVEQNNQITPKKLIDSLQYEPSFFNYFLARKTVQMEEIFGSSKEEAKYKVGQYFMEKFPFILFVSLPFLTIAFYLLYYRQHKTYAEHMVLTFQIMSFVFLLLLMLFFLETFFSISMHAWLGILLLHYVYKSLRNFYEQGRWKTIVKMGILTILLSFVTSLTGLMMLLLAFLLY